MTKRVRQGISCEHCFHFWKRNLLTPDQGRDAYVDRLAFSSSACKLTLWVYFLARCLLMRSDLGVGELEQKVAAIHPKCSPYGLGRSGGKMKQHRIGRSDERCLNETGMHNTVCPETTPCFTPGTLIATPKGERAVESLQVGDPVITRDNGIQHIRWTGGRRLDAKELSRASHLQPVLVLAGSLGQGQPERDMLVSPNHRMLVSNDKTALFFEEPEVLVPAKHLTGVKGIDGVLTTAVIYIHMMFDRHEVILADGCWTESFQPEDHSLGGMDNAQRTEIFELFPSLRLKAGRLAYAPARRVLSPRESLFVVH